jgi:hypothetical protein
MLENVEKIICKFELAPAIAPVRKYSVPTVMFPETVSKIT